MITKTLKDFSKKFLEYLLTKDNGVGDIECPYMCLPITSRTYHVERFTNSYFDFELIKTIKLPHRRIRLSSTSS